MTPAVTTSYTVVVENASGCRDTAACVTLEVLDCFPEAITDSYTLPEDAPATNLPVLTNDDFGGNGPSTGSITITSIPSHGTATVNNGGTPNDPTDDQITYTPTANYNGPDQLIYQICDSDNDCDTAIVYLSITSVDDFPEAITDSYSLPEDAPATNLPVLVNDDFGGDGPSTGAITITSNPSHGTATVNDGGTANDPTDDQITYTPTANYNGPDQLIYQICDFDGDCDTAIVYLNITSVDDFPVAVADSYTLPEDAPATNLPVLINDDFGGDGPSNSAIFITSSPSHGTAVVNNGGTPNDPTDDQIIYKPTANYNGPDALIYQICDIDGDCDTALVSITITSVDDQPIAIADTYNLPEDAPATNLPVLLNDDFGGDGPSTGAITITSNPSHGTATVNNGGTPNDPTDDQITYTPTANYNGTDQLIYQICDFDNDCDTAIVYLSINSDNDAPVLQDDRDTTCEDTPAFGDVSLNDTDLDGPGKSITLVSGPAHGSINLNLDGTYTYTPASNYFGFDTVVYSYCDLGTPNLCDTASLFIVVTPVNDSSAKDKTVECDGNGNVTDLQTWLSSNGGASPGDFCLGCSWTNDFTSLSDSCGATGSATVTFTLTYPCGTRSTTATFRIIDTTDPVIDTTAKNRTVECDGNGNAAELQAWLAANGGAAASDICSGDVTWSNDFDSLSNGCGATGSARVTFTATDACGNSTSTTATFTIVDTTDPVIDTAAKNKTVECDGAGNAADLQAWLAINGGASASDICSGTVTWSNDFDSLSNDCGATGSARVTYTATDACGNSASTTATFTIIDTTDPVIDTAAKNKTVECDGNGNAADLQAWLAANGGASASDICSGDVTWSNDFGGQLSNDCGATGSARVTFTATDACGNSASTSATFTIIDTTDPVIDTAAKNKTVECDGAGNAADLQAWLAINGGAVASDICSGDVTWSNDFDSLSNGCGATGSARVTFTATDACGNSASTTATFTIEDTTDPELTAEATDKSVECDGQGNAAALQAWLASNGGATASDICSGTVTWSNDFDSLSNGCGATGSATVTFTAADECGNTVSTTATFAIVDTTAPFFISTLPGDITVCDIVPVPPVIRASDNCGTANVSLNETVDSVTVAGVKIYTRRWTAADECDNQATHTQTITVNSSVVINIDSTVCEGETVTIGNNIYGLTGTYQVLFATAAGCDSVVNLDLTVNPVKYTNVDAVICQGEQVIAGGQVFTTSVTDSVIVLSTSLGCDSIITVNIQVLGQDTVIANRTICDGGSVTLGDSTYNTAGTYYVPFQNNQCTGIVQLNLSVNANTTSTLNEAICEGDIYILAGSVFATAGTYTVTIDNAQGCDSVITLNLTVNPTVSSQVDTAICRGESITIGQSTFNTSGNYQVMLQSSLGCDSLVNLNLIVLDNGDTTFVDQTICQGDSVVINGQPFTQAGIYYVSIANGRCTNFVELTLNVKPTSKTTISEAICQGESIVVGGQTFTQTGTYTINLTNSVGCDSTITLNLDVSQGGVKTQLDTVICEGSSVTFAGQTFSTTGIYQIIYPSGVCRDTLLLNLTVNPTYTTTVDTTICEGSGISLGGNVFSLTGNYTVVLQSAQGCDSTIRLNLTVNPVKRTDIDAVICFGEQVVVGSQVFTSSVTNEVIVLSTSEGCDSIITLNLVVLKQDTLITDRTICAGDYVEIGGNIFTDAGTYYIPFQNNQCEGIVQLNLDVNEPTAESITRRICEGDIVVVAGQVYSTTGTYTILTSNAAGCDSIITLNLTVTPAATTRIDSTICRGESVTVGGALYSVQGLYNITLASAAGCDSVVVLNLTVLNAGDTSRVSQSVCEGETVTVGGQTFSQAGVYYINTPNGRCTNVIELTLEVKPISKTTVNQAICQGDAVVIGNQTFTASGTYTVTLQNAAGCDSTITLDLYVSQGGVKTQVDTAICAGGSVTIAGQTFTQTGTYQVVYPSGACRDTLLLNLVVNKVYEIAESRSICSNRPDSILWEGQYYSVPGTYTKSFTSAQGCDSIRVLNLDANVICPTINIDTIIYDTIPIKLIDTVCVSSPGGGPNEEIVACDGSISGTGNYGTWTIDTTTGCLYYVAGTIKGNDTMCVSACDTVANTCITTTIIITVTGVPPIAVNDTIRTVPGTPVDIPVLVNDTSEDSDPLELCDGSEIVTTPTHGTVVINGDGTITYTPDIGYAGLDSFQYKICDPDGADTAWVFIAIEDCEIPNAFSPNGDDFNETFNIPCIDPNNPVFLAIYNRWGIEVFRHEAYDNSWDGTYKGNPLPDGTYYFVLKYTNTQGTYINEGAFVVIHR